MKKGYSIIETMIALSIASTVIYIASTSFMSLSPKYKLRKAAGEVYARLQYARYKAIFEGRPMRVRFASNGYTVEKFDEVKKNWQPVLAAILEGVSIEANNSPVFYPVGTVSNLATMLVSNRAGKYKLTLAISGRIKMTML